MSGRRLYVLLGHDAATGAATATAAVVGVDGGHWVVSWMPYEPAAEPWRQRLGEVSVAVSDALEAWAEGADGVSFDVVELEPAGSPDLRGDVEAALDELLVARGG
jgi:hypothetical protein